MVSTPDWYALNLGDAMLSQSALSELQDRLSEIYQESGSPENMLAVYRHESRELHCQIMVFLTAEFQQLAKLEGALRCGTPKLGNTSHLAGNAGLLTGN